MGGRKQTAWSVDDPGYAGTLVDTVPSNAYDLTTDGLDGCRFFLLASLAFAAPSVEWQGLLLVLFATMLAAARVPRVRVGRTARETKQTPTGFAAAHCTSAFEQAARSRGGKGTVAAVEVLTTARDKTCYGRKSSRGVAVGRSAHPQTRTEVV